MTLPTSKDAAVLIVGAGAFGLATALELARADYKDITVIEKDSQIPSRFSAAYDINKIVRAEYADSFYVDLALEAIEEWKTPLYAPYYHQTGYLHTTSGNAPAKAKAALTTSLQSVIQHPKLMGSIIPIIGSAQIRSLVWQYQDGPLNGWKGYFNRHAGYAHSSKAMRAVFEECIRMGVKFVIDPGDGHAAELLFSTSSTRRCIGLRAVSGRQYAAEKVILALGASAPELLPELRMQVEARSWSVAHVKLTPNETSALRGIPVTYARDLGFFFEPDPETNLLKLCPMGAGFTNYSLSKIASLPPPYLADSAFIPVEDEAQIRQLLQQTLPALANRPLVDTKLCWFADTKDSDYIIDYVPNTESSVVILSGDSGHGFKMFPIFGGWVRNLLESEDPKQIISRWAWKEPKVAAVEDHDIIWRLGATKDFKDLTRAHL